MPFTSVAFATEAPDTKLVKTINNATRSATGPRPPRKPDHFQHFPSFVTALYVAIYFPDDSRF